MTLKQIQIQIQTDTIKAQLSDLSISIFWSDLAN